MKWKIIILIYIMFFIFLFPSMIVFNFLRIKQRQQI